MKQSPFVSRQIQTLKESIAQAIVGPFKPQPIQAIQKPSAAKKVDNKCQKENDIKIKPKASVKKTSLNNENLESSTLVRAKLKSKSRP